MPTIAVDKADLFGLLGRTYSSEEFDDLCFAYGLELDGDTTDDPGRGTDRPELKIEVPANRYDLLCIEGIARAINIYLGRDAAPTFRLADIEPTYCLTVQPQTERIRPYAAAAILHNVAFTPRSYDSFISLQDKLHQNLGRQRTLVSMGTHDLDKIQGPFVYDALPPQQIAFIPLSQTESMHGAELISLFETDRSTRHISRYTHIIKDSPVYPVMLDSRNKVLSLPPIINGEYSKIEHHTRNVFIEITGIDMTKVEVALNMLVTMFSVYSTERFTVRPVQIISEHNGQTRITPNLRPRLTQASLSSLNSGTGLALNADEACSLLKRMSLTATRCKSDGNILEVEIPVTRADILHECDILEDFAVAYGFNSLPKTFPNRSFTVAKSLPLNKLSDIVRQEVALAGWTEILSLILCSHDENYNWLRRTDDGQKGVILANPKTVEYQIVRTTLFPGLLKTVRENKHHPLPLKLFEVSDVVYKDMSCERGARNERHFGSIWCGRIAGFEIVHGLIDRVMAMLECDFVDPESAAIGYWLEPSSDPLYFPGRAATIKLRDSATKITTIGSFGIIHPHVLKNFDINYLCSGVEMNIEVFL